MKKDQQAHSFRLVKIEEKQFSYFEIEDIEEKEIQEKIGFAFGVSTDHQLISCGCHYMLEVIDKPFINIEALCYFEMLNADWEKKLIKGKSLVIAKDLAHHLAMITSGTTRGILFANTKNTPFNDYPMGLININKIIKEDINITI